MKVYIKDRDSLRLGEHDTVASTVIPVHEIIKYGEVSGWFQLNKSSNKSKSDPDDEEGRISLRISYKPKYELAYRHGDGYSYDLFYWIFKWFTLNQPYLKILKEMECYLQNCEGLRVLTPDPGQVLNIF